jgi:hypothetical protein
LIKKSFLSYDRFLLLVALLAIFILFSRPPADVDMWWHLRSGEEMVKHSHILLEDIFSHTRAGETWVNAFWLADIVFYLVFSAGSFLGLAGFVALFGVLTFGLVAQQIKLPPIWRMLVLILAALTAAPMWTPRPQLFSFLLLALLDAWLVKVKLGEKRDFWLLVPLFALWANLHGGYVWGILLLIAFLVGEIFNHWFGDLKQDEDALPFPEIKRLFLFLLLGSAAVLLNPSGVALWRLPFHTIDVSLFIEEWLSPNFHDYSLHPILWMLFLLILGLANSTKKLDFTSLFKVLGFAYLTFFSQRNLAPYAIILLPVLSDILLSFGTSLRESRLLQSWQKKNLRSQTSSQISEIINVFLLFLIVFVAAIKLYDVTRPAQIYAEYPEAAVGWIAENQPEGAIFNSYNWGGYLTWQLRDYPVFIDGRADLFAQEIIGQWFTVVGGGEAAQEILNDWDVNLILLEPDWVIVRELPALGWELYFQDEKSVVFGR